jgi:hypothetical protein
VVPLSVTPNGERYRIIDEGVEIVRIVHDRRELFSLF